MKNQCFQSGKYNKTEGVPFQIATRSETNLNSFMLDKLESQIVPKSRNKSFRNIDFCLTLGDPSNIFQLVNSLGAKRFPKVRVLQELLKELEPF